METIISKLYELIQQTGNLIELEESIRLFMYEVFASQLGLMLRHCLFSWII